MTNPAPPRERTSAVPRGQKRQVALPGQAKPSHQGGVRGGLLLLGLLLVVASGGGFWYVLQSIDARQGYLVAARTIQRWDVTTPADFTVVEANVGSAAALPVDGLGVVVGKWATGRIPAGTFVTAGMFQSPPLSGDDDKNKVRIEVSLPAGEAPGGQLATGDKLALFGAESSGLDGAAGPLGLIGVLTLEFVQGDKITYIVTPSEAKAIEETVDRYMSAADRRIWKVGFELPTEELSELFGGSRNVPALADDAFADLGTGPEPIDEP